MSSDSSGESKKAAASIAALALTGVALVVEPVTGVASLIARVAALGSNKITDHQIQKLGERAASLEARVGALEESRLPTRTLRGTPLKLLAYCLYREGTELFTFAEADDAITAMNLSPEDYRHAAEELRTLGLVKIDGNVGHRSGIARTRLRPAAFLAAAPVLLSEVDLPTELQRVFDVLRSAPREHYRVRVSEILEHTGIPVARLDLIIRALEDLELLVGHGPGSREWGWYMDVSVTPAGRRVLRGDDPLLV